MFLQGPGGVEIIGRGLGGSFPKDSTIPIGATGVSTAAACQAQRHLLFFPHAHPPPPPPLRFCCFVVEKKVMRGA